MENWVASLGLDGRERDECQMAQWIWSSLERFTSFWKCRKRASGKVGSTEANLSKRCLMEARWQLLCLTARNRETFFFYALLSRSYEEVMLCEKLEKKLNKRGAQDAWLIHVSTVVGGSLSIKDTSPSICGAVCWKRGSCSRGLAQ